MGYMRYDLQQFFVGGNPTQLSDASRVLSMQYGLQLFTQFPVMGTGIGNLKKDMSAMYTAYPDMPAEKRFPHNQFVYVLASGGIIGFMIFCYGIFTPLIYRRNFKRMLFLMFYVIALSSFFTEATLEEQMGTGFFCVFGLLLYSSTNLQEL